MVASILFILVLGIAIFLFSKKIRQITRDINIGKDVEITDNRAKRWKRMFLIAIGQQKMTRKPVAAILHVFVYVGFIIVNIEMLEILLDGVAGTHRMFAFLGPLYSVLISSFEVVGLTVMIACAFFLIRRNLIRVKRFWNPEMTRWPRTDANIILITELFLMSAILIMNATDGLLQQRPDMHYAAVGSFTISSLIQPWFSGMSTNGLVFLERFCWWFHIVGVLAFLNYIPYSKHLHVFLSFPNVYYSKLKPRAEMANMPAITNEVKKMLAEDFSNQSDEEEIIAFGANEVSELNWKHLMDVYTCTECGRCTASCPANLTAKKLSPRKIIMDTRDRLEEYGKGQDKLAKNEKIDFEDGKSLFNYISSEELWACTTCNACTQECPVNIDPVSIIMEMRRHLVMEKSDAPAPLNTMMANIENNGAPWQYSQDDRLEWVKT